MTAAEPPAQTLSQDRLARTAEEQQGPAAPARPPKRQRRGGEGAAVAATVAAAVATAAEPQRAPPAAASAGPRLAPAAAAGQAAAAAPAPPGPGASAGAGPAGGPADALAAAEGARLAPEVAGRQQEQALAAAVRGARKRRAAGGDRARPPPAPAAAPATAAAVAAPGPQETVPPCRALPALGSRITIRRRQPGKKGEAAVVLVVWGVCVRQKDELAPCTPPRACLLLHLHAPFTLQATTSPLWRQWTAPQAWPCCAMVTVPPTRAAWPSSAGCRWRRGTVRAARRHLHPQLRPARPSKWQQPGPLRPARSCSSSARTRSRSCKARGSESGSGSNGVSERLQVAPRRSPGCGRPCASMVKTHGSLEGVQGAVC